MATYASLTSLRGPQGRLDQFTTTAGVADTSKDTVLTECLVNATAAVNSFLGITTNITAAASSIRTLYGDGGLWLSADVPMAAVTLITAPSGYTVPSYLLQNGVLRITDSSGLLVSPAYPSLSAPSSWNEHLTGWAQGIPYAVTATFGYTADDLALVADATLERAVQLWRFKDAGGSETIGAEGAITTVKMGWTPGTKEALTALKRRIHGNSVGVF